MQLEKLPALAAASAPRTSHRAGISSKPNEDALLRRYSETRRPHPVGKESSVRESLHHERKLMEPIRKLADVVIDTSKFNVHELRQFITERFRSARKGPCWFPASASAIEYGVPTDADLVFDVRFLPNPHFVPSCGRLPARIRKFGDTSVRFRRQANFFGASRGC